MKIGNAGRPIDVAVTLICWCYFILGFVFFFSPFYLAAAFFPARSERLFQRLNRSFYRGFFGLLKRIAPRQHWSIDPAIAGIHSSVVVCNHLSYLDPILLISLLDRAKTIVKPVFFAVPIFGWVLRKAGYFPATTAGPHAQLMLTQMEKMGEYLAGGGNLFIFPQGTRSRDGRIGELNQGAFKIARYCQAPVYILCLRNTEKLFTPGKFFFFTRKPNRISISIVDKIIPDAGHLTLPELHARVRKNLESCMCGLAGETGQEMNICQTCTEAGANTVS
jgi:1-acyl-sn-glycerol-3-phosphate acyltransferase